MACVYLVCVCVRLCMCVSMLVCPCVSASVRYASVQCMCTFRVPDWGHNVLNPWRYDTCTESLVHKFA